MLEQEAQAAVPPVLGRMDPEGYFRKPRRARVPVSRVLLFLLAILCAACSRLPARPRVPNPATSLPLYRAPQGGDHVVVLARLGGPELPFILDTGASANVLSAARAWYLDLPRIATSLRLSDMASAEVSVSQIQSGFILPPLGTPALFAAHLPRLDSVGLAGLFSPQTLSSAVEAVVVDLAAGTLALTHTSTVPPDASLQGTSCPGPTGRVYRVDAQVAGFPVRLVVDTGAPHTTLRADSTAGRALLAAAEDSLRASELNRLLGEPSADDQARTKQAGGVVAAERVVLLPQKSVRAGGIRLDLDVEVGRVADPPACRADGALGLDFLSGWILVLTPQRLLGRWAGPSRLALRTVLPPLPPVAFDGIEIVGSCSGIRPPKERSPQPLPYENPLTAWPLLSSRLRREAEAVAAACIRAGSLRADVRIDLQLSPDRQRVRGLVTITAGPRYRTGRVTLRLPDGTPPPELPLDRLREGDWYDASYVDEQAAELNRRLAPSGLAVIGKSWQIDDATRRVDLEFRLGPLLLSPRESPPAP